MNVAILSIESILPCSSLPKALSFSFRRFLSIRTPRSCHAVKHFKGFSLQHAAMAEQIRTSHPGHPGIVSVSIMIVYWYVFVRDLHAYKGKTMRHQQVCLSATFPACWEPLLQIFATTCMTRNNVLRTCVAKLLRNIVKFIQHLKTIKHTCLMQSSITIIRMIGIIAILNLGALQ